MTKIEKGRDRGKKNRLRGRNPASLTDGEMDRQAKRDEAKPTDGEMKRKEKVAGEKLGNDGQRGTGDTQRWQLREAWTAGRKISSHVRESGSRDHAGA